MFKIKNVTYAFFVLSYSSFAQWSQPSNGGITTSFKSTIGSGTAPVEMLDVYGNMRVLGTGTSSTTITAGGDVYGFTLRGSVATGQAGFLNFVGQYNAHPSAAEYIGNVYLQGGKAGTNARSGSITFNVTDNANNTSSLNINNKGQLGIGTYASGTNYLELAKGNVKLPGANLSDLNDGVLQFGNVVSGRFMGGRIYSRTHLGASESVYFDVSGNTSSQWAPSLLFRTDIGAGAVEKFRIGAYESRFSNPLTVNSTLTVSQVATFINNIRANGSIQGGRTTTTLTLAANTDFTNGPIIDLSGNEDFYGNRNGNLLLVAGKGVDYKRGDIMLAAAINNDNTLVTHMTIKNNGNVGIGTQTPAEKLHVEGNLLVTGTTKLKSWVTPSEKYRIEEDASLLNIVSAGVPRMQLSETGVIQIGYKGFTQIPELRYSGMGLSVNEVGKVSIGVDKPDFEHSLRVHGSSLITGRVRFAHIDYDKTGSVAFDMPIEISSDVVFKQNSRLAGNIVIDGASVLPNQPRGNLTVNLPSNFNTEATFNARTVFNGTAAFNQGFAIGTGCLPDGYKFAVAGAAKFKKIRVETQAWCDFVFEDQYKLPALHEVKAYVQKHKHLPDVPSEKTVLKEGVDVAEMNQILLKKVEELYLHVINLQEEITALKKNR